MFPFLFQKSRIWNLWRPFLGKKKKINESKSGKGLEGDVIHV